ncbi:hypothetical protein PSTT_11319, partial [Puccinia striiformis]
MTVAKFTHVAIFSLVIIGCLAEIVTSGILVGDFTVRPSLTSQTPRRIHHHPCPFRRLTIDAIHLPACPAINRNYRITPQLRQGQDIFVLWPLELTFLFSTIYVVGLSTAPDHLLFSVASHLIWLGVTIVLFVSGAAALTTEIKGQHFPHQQRLEMPTRFRLG